jgi:hypothetical protein
MLRLAVMVPVGGFSYLVTGFALWLACGKPAGPEREAVDLMWFVRGRVLRTAPESGHRPSVFIGRGR